jgi:hypothetical protein
MKAPTTTAAVPSTSSTANGGNDRLALVRERQLLDLVVDLDGVYDALMGSALNGNGGYELAVTVREATDYLINLRLNAAR